MQVKSETMVVVIVVDIVAEDASVGALDEGLGMVERALYMSGGGVVVLGGTPPWRSGSSAFQLHHASDQQGYNNFCLVSRNMSKTDIFHKCYL